MASATHDDQTDTGGFQCVRSYKPQSRYANVRSRLRVGATYTIISTACGRGGALVTSVIAAHLLTTAAFGRLGLLQSTINAFITVATLGIGAFSAKHVAELRHTDKERLSRILQLIQVLSISFAVLASLVLLMFASHLAETRLHSGELKTALRLGSLFLLFTAVDSSQTGVLQGFEAFRAIASTNVKRIAIGIPLFVFGILSAHLNGAITALAVTAAVACYCNARAIRSLAPVRTSSLGLSQLLKERTLLWNSSIPAALSSATSIPALWLSQTQLVATAGYTQAAIFAAAFQLRVLLGVVPAMSNQVILPVLTALRVGDHATAPRKLSTISTLSVTFCTAAAATILLLLRGPIVRIYGTRYATSTRVLIPLTIASVISACNSGLATTLLSRNRFWSVALCNMTFGAMLVVLAHELIPRAGAVGLGYAFLSSECVATVAIGLASAARCTTNNTPSGTKSKTSGRPL